MRKKSIEKILIKNKKQIMKKESLLKFIEKYNLGDNISTVLIKSENNTVSVDFISDDKTAKGSVVMNDFKDLGESELGIYSTGKLKKMLDVLDENIDVDYKRESAAGKISSVIFYDKKIKTKYVVCESSVIPVVPKLKSEPSYEIEINIDTKFIDDFIKVNNAIDAETFTIITDDNTVKFVFGYVKHTNTNTITLDIIAKTQSNIDEVTLNSNMLAEVLKANKDLKSGYIKVSSAGLSFVKFTSDKYETEYYLVAVQSM